MSVQGFAWAGGGPGSRCRTENSRFRIRPPAARPAGCLWRHGGPPPRACPSSRPPPQFLRETAVGKAAYHQRASIEGAELNVPVLPATPVLTIFWILPLAGPMSILRRVCSPAAQQTRFTGEMGGIAGLLRRWQAGVRTVQPAASGKETSNMKRALSMLAAILLVAASSGCGHDRMYRVQREGAAGLMRGSCTRCPDVCRSCRRGGGDPGGFTPGPPVGAVTYPYYTLRGPRDFLASNPPSIGP